MKKKTVNYSWPAILCNFKESDSSQHSNFTKGELWVAYEGETPDHRLLSKNFFEQALPSLPYTPIVSFYDEDEGDFVGHARQQSIYGIVDPLTEPRFEKGEDGNLWLVCDTIYYTERPDKVGEIAKKIAGHKHSLELNPETVKYVVNYDDKKHFKNIEFTAGDFIGVSVLGDKQKPAFPGAAFFSEKENNTDFEKKMKLLKDFCRAQKEETKPIDGGKSMDYSNFTHSQFLELSYGEISLKVDEAIRNDYQETAYTEIVEVFENYAIVHFYFWAEQVCRLERVMYSCDKNGNITLGEIKEVRVTYVDVEVNEDNNEPSSEDGTFKATETEEKDAKVEEQDFKDKDLDDDPDDDDKEDKDEESEEEDRKEDDDPDFTSNEEAQETATMTAESNSVSESLEENFEEDKSEEDEDENAASSDEKKKEEDDESTPAEEFKEKSVVEANETAIQENDSSSSAFTESEAGEREAAEREKEQRQEKLGLLGSFKDLLTTEQFTEYSMKIDDIDIKDLEIALLKYKISATEALGSKKDNSGSSTKSIKQYRLFSATNPTNSTATNNFDAVDNAVQKYLHKK